MEEKRVVKGKVFDPVVHNLCEFCGRVIDKPSRYCGCNDKCIRYVKGEMIRCPKAIPGRGDESCRECKWNCRTYPKLFKGFKW